VAKKVGLAASEPSPYIIQRPEDRRSGQLQFSAGMVVALIGASVDLIMLFLLAFGLSTLGTSVAALVFACVIAAGVGMAATGRRRSALARHLSTYAQLCGTRATVAISELAQGAGRTEADVRKDLAIAYKQGLLPHGRITDDGSTLFLTEDAYAAAQTWQATGEDAPQEVQQILDAGNAAIRTIDSCKASVGDAAMTQKLDRLETTVRRILEQVQKKPCLRRRPAPLHELLPPHHREARHGLLRARPQGPRRQERRGHQGGDLGHDGHHQRRLRAGARQHVQDEAWDISSDIHVMKTMMEQEGLTKGTGTQDGKDQARNG
jgi:hypothetical protein